MFHAKRKLVAAMLMTLISAQSAYAALTIGATTARSDGALNVSAAAGSATELADLNTIGKTLTEQFRKVRNILKAEVIMFLQ